MLCNKPAMLRVCTRWCASTSMSTSHSKHKAFLNRGTLMASPNIEMLAMVSSRLLQHLTLQNKRNPDVLWREVVSGEGVGGGGEGWGDGLGGGVGGWGGGMGEKGGLSFVSPSCGTLCCPSQSLQC